MIIFMFFFTPRDIAQAQKKINNWISKNFMIICLKGTLKERFSFSGNVT